MQVYEGPAKSKLCGLAIANDDPVSPLIVTTEHLSGKCRALFVRRNSDAKLQVVQSVVIDETLGIYSDRVTFARWPEGNLFCAINNTSSLHEFTRAPSASRTQFEDTSRKHPLSNKVRCICGLQSNGVCRLAASFVDKSIRVFRVAAAGCALVLLQRVQLQRVQFTRPQTSSSRSLIALPGGSLVYSLFTDLNMFGIECCAAKSDGTLSSPTRLFSKKPSSIFLIRLLFSRELGFSLWALLPPTEAFPTYRLIANYDNCELCLLSIKAE